MRAAALALALAACTLSAQTPKEDWQRAAPDVMVDMSGVHTPTYFHVFMVVNLPDSGIVGDAQSVLNDVEGSCSTRTFTVLGAVFYAGPNRTGVPLYTLPPDGFVREVMSGSAMQDAFGLLCSAR